MAISNNRTSSSNNVAQAPGQETPLIDRPKPLSSQFKTYANVFVAIAGSGDLALPYAFRRAGWILGLIMLFAVAFLTYYSMMLLISIRKKLNSGNRVENVKSYGDLGLKVCGSFGELAVDVLVVLAQVGFCIGYLVLIGTTVDLLNSSEVLELDLKSISFWGHFLFQLGLNSIPSLTHLAPISVLADILDIVAMGVILLCNIIILLKRRVLVKAFGGLSQLFYGLGVAVYSFEGIGMTLPLESEMRDRDKFGKVLGITMILMCLLYGCFGSVGYFAFGEQTAELITANMGDGLVSTLVKFGLCVNSIFTLPVMMNPVYEILERRFSEGRYCLWLRWFSVSLVTLAALLVPNFADFLSLVGSLVCCALTFVLPSFFHLLAFKDERDCRTWFSDVGIMVLGIVLGVAGTWVTLEGMVSTS